MKVGFIGTGNMGNPMAANLIKAGHQLTVHDLRDCLTTVGWVRTGRRGTASRAPTHFPGAGSGFVSLRAGFNSPPLTLPGSLFIALKSVRCYNFTAESCICER